MVPNEAPKSIETVESLHQTIQERERQFGVLGRLSAIISQSDQLRPALNEILDELLALTNSQMGGVFELDDASGNLTPIGSRGVSQSFLDAERCIPLGNCLCGEAARTGVAVSAPDIASTPQLTRSACRDERFASVLSIPLRSRERIVGVLALFSRESRELSDSDRNLFRLIGDQIGIALENSRLYARSRDMAVLEERSQIAQEIHDGIAQNLAFLNMETKKLETRLTSSRDADALADLRRIRQVIQDSYAETRELLTEFRTKLKDSEGLRETLERYVREFGARNGLRAEFQYESNGLPPLSATARVQVFRIVQEALSNVRKHAKAKLAFVSVQGMPDQWRVEIRDDGKGFDPDRTKADGTQFGLEIMGERASHLNGKFAIRSSPGRGTSVTVTVPLDSGRE